MMKWHDISGWFLEGCESEAYQHVCKDMLVLELGAWMGRSTACAAEVARAVVTIEHFEADDSIRALYQQPRSPDTLRKELDHKLTACGVRDKVFIIDDKWEDVLVPTIKRMKPEVIFYDADHSVEPVRQFFSQLRFALVAMEPYYLQIRHSLPTICVHDYGKTDTGWHDGTTPGVDKFLTQQGAKMELHGSLAVITLSAIV